MTGDAPDAGRLLFIVGVAAVDKLRELEQAIVILALGLVRDVGARAALRLQSHVGIGLQALVPGGVLG